MKKGYDLIIIGDTQKSFILAELAVNYNAKVALLVNYYNHQKLFIDAYKNNYLALDYSEYLNHKIATLSDQTIPKLKQLGVDIITEQFRFAHTRKLQIETSQDLLFATRYLLNLSRNNYFKLINDGQKVNNYLSLDDLIITNQWETLPQKLAVVGNDIPALYLSLQLIKLGKQVSLFISSDRLLPSEDKDISWYLQLYLEAQGIKIYTFDIHTEESFLLLEKEIEKIIVTDSQKYQINDYLKLIHLGIQFNQQNIVVNRKLKTDNHQIYACGDLLGGYCLEHLTEYEGKIAIANALFFPYRKIDYSNIPYSLKTNPEIYRIGYTDEQARLLQGNSIKIISFCPSLTSCLDEQNTIYFLKIILDNYDRILGFHCLGVNKELFATINLLKQKKINFKYLFKFNFDHQNTQELVRQIKEIYQNQNKGKNSFIISARETFFMWKNNYI